MAEYRSSDRDNYDTGRRATSSNARGFTLASSGAVAFISVLRIRHCPETLRRLEFFLLIDDFSALRFTTAAVDVFPDSAGRSL